MAMDLKPASGQPLIDRKAESALSTPSVQSTGSLMSGFQVGDILKVLGREYRSQLFARVHDELKDRLDWLPDAPEGMEHAEVLENDYLGDPSKIVIRWQGRNEGSKLIKEGNKQIVETQPQIKVDDIPSIGCFGHAVYFGQNQGKGPYFQLHQVSSELEGLKIVRENEEPGENEENDKKDIKVGQKLIKLLKPSDVVIGSPKVPKVEFQITRLHRSLLLGDKQEHIADFRSYTIMNSYAIISYFRDKQDHDPLYSLRMQPVHLAAMIGDHTNMKTLLECKASAGSIAYGCHNRRISHEQNGVGWLTPLFLATRLKKQLHQQADAGTGDQHHEKSKDEANEVCQLLKKDYRVDTYTKCWNIWSEKWETAKEIEQNLHGWRLMQQDVKSHQKAPPGFVSRWQHELWTSLCTERKDTQRRDQRKDAKFFVMPRTQAVSNMYKSGGTNFNTSWARKCLVTFGEEVKV